MFYSFRFRGIRHLGWARIPFDEESRRDNGMLTAPYLRLSTPTSGLKGALLDHLTPRQDPDARRVLPLLRLGTIITA